MRGHISACFYSVVLVDMNIEGVDFSVIVLLIIFFSLPPISLSLLLPPPLPPSPPLGTDRHNMVQTPNPNSNYPCVINNMCGESSSSDLFANAEVVWGSFPTQTDLALAFMSGGYYNCLEPVTGCTESVSAKTQMQQLLNNVSPSFAGALLRFSPGTYYYICSRNNNFTNRSQKGMLTVKEATPSK